MLTSQLHHHLKPPPHSQRPLHHTSRAPFLPPPATDRIHSLTCAFTPPSHNGVKNSRAPALRSRTAAGAGAKRAFDRSDRHVDQQVKWHHHRRCMYLSHQGTGSGISRLIRSTGLLRPQGRPSHRAQAHGNQLLLLGRRPFRGSILPRHRKPYVGTLELSRARATYANKPAAQLPRCPKGIMQWQHGSYEKLANGSLHLKPIKVDGRQLYSDPCQYKNSVFTRYNATEKFKVRLNP